MATFTDAQAMLAMHPATFEAPSADELKAIKIGSLVKICADEIERFWVEVTSVNGDTLDGIIDNDLRDTNIHQLKLGDIVSFERRHIYQIY